MTQSDCALLPQATQSTVTSDSLSLSSPRSKSSLLQSFGSLGKAHLAHGHRCESLPATEAHPQASPTCSSLLQHYDLSDTALPLCKCFAASHKPFKYCAAAATLPLHKCAAIALWDCTVPHTCPQAELAKPTPALVPTRCSMQCGSQNLDLRASTAAS